MNFYLKTTFRNLRKKPVYSLISFIGFTFGILILTFCVSSCSRNKLKTDENSLTKQILTEEEQLAREAELRAEREKQLADSLAKLPKGFRFKEDRSVDLQRPPLVIDIARNLNNIKEIKLSDVATDIKYIRMESLPEAISTTQRFKYYLMDNNIVAVSLYGIFLFSNDGKFIRNIVKNEFSGISDDETRKAIIIQGDHTFKGGGTTVWARGNSLFYKYSDNITGQDYIMEYDCSLNQPTYNIEFDSENQKKIIGAGEIVFDLKQDNETTNKTQNNLEGAWWIPLDALYNEIKTFAPDKNTYLKRFWDKVDKIGVFQKNGDTLAVFTNHDQVKDHFSTDSQIQDVGTQYEKNGSLLFRSDFNDTIFQVVPPNRFLPVYVFNLGRHKYSKQESVDMVSLIDKVMIKNVAETKNYIFITFTKDNYDCPRNRKNKSVKIYHALFSKSSNQLQIVKSDPFDYEAPILVNNIDGGYSIWPLSYQVASNGEIMLSLKGSDLKTQVKSSEFQKSAAPADKKEKLKQLANSVSDLDDILMIVQ